MKPPDKSDKSDKSDNSELVVNMQTVQHSPYRKRQQHNKVVVLLMALCLIVAQLAAIKHGLSHVTVIDSTVVARMGVDNANSRTAISTSNEHNRASTSVATEVTDKDLAQHHQGDCKLCSAFHLVLLAVMPVVGLAIVAIIDRFFRCYYYLIAYTPLCHTYYAARAPPQWIVVV